MPSYLLNFINLFIGMRKTIAWFGLMIVSVVLLIKGYINGSQFADLAKDTFLGFIAGNMTEHISSTVKEFLNSKGQQVAKTVEEVVESAVK